MQNCNQTQFILVIENGNQTSPITVTITHLQLRLQLWLEFKNTVIITWINCI